MSLRYVEASNARRRLVRLDVPWGTGMASVEVDDHRVAGVVGAKVERAGDRDVILLTAIARPGAHFKDF